MKRETVKTIVIVALVSLLLGSLLVFLIIPKHNAKIYGEGFTAGQIDVIITQMQTGNIFIINNENKIESYSISTICGAQAGE